MSEQSKPKELSDAEKAVAAAKAETEKKFGTNKHLSSFGTFGELANIKKMDDVLEQPLLVLDYFLAKGDTGPYAFIRCHTLDGEEVNVTCGGTFVMEALKKVKEQDAFPVIATFYKKGKAILVR